MDDYIYDWGYGSDDEYSIFDEVADWYGDLDFSWWDDSDTSWLTDPVASAVTEIVNTAAPGEEAHGWRYFSDGTAIAPGGSKYYYQGEEVYDANSGTLSGILAGALSAGGDAAKKLLFKDGDASKGINMAGLGTLAAGAYKMFGGGDDINTGGYSKPVPIMSASREAVQYDDANRRPGSAGRRYFSDTTFTPSGGDVAGARAAAQTQAAGIAAAAPQYQAPAEPSPATPAPWERATSEFRQTGNPVAPSQQQPSPIGQINPQTGGLAMAAGGSVPKFNGSLHNNGFVLPGDVVAHADPLGEANKERGLQALHKQFGVEAIRGPGDAMSDSIKTNIDGQEPARVANGEAYVRPENVAKAGGGDMDEGASRLRGIMDELRKKRTGSTKQINPDNEQELRAAYGGSVKRFNTGDTVAGTTGGVTTSPTGAAVTGYGSSSANTLSPWVGDYVTNALGQGAAVADQPYQAYTGPLTAGASDLQGQAFAGATQMANSGYTPTQYQGGLFNAEAAQQYMNPYLQAALDPQLKEMKRQSDIQRLSDASRLTKAGAFGGGRQAIMESEGNRNLLDLQGQALGKGYADAYASAMGQFNADQNRRMDADKATEASRQYSADFSRQSLADLAKMGDTQRTIEQQGIDADKAQFEEERGWAYQMPQYKLNLLANLPTGGTVSTPNTTDYSQFSQGLGDLTAIYEELSKLGQTT